MTRFTLLAKALRTAPGDSSPARQLAGGTFWTLLGTAGARVAAFLASLVIARLLGRDTFGELGVIESSIGMFAVLSNLGLSLTSIKFVAKYRRTDPAKAGRILALCGAFAAVSGLAMAGGALAAAPWLAAHSLGAPHLASILQLATALIVLSALNGALNGALIGFQAFKQTAQLNLVTGLLSFPLLTAGALLGGLYGVVCGMVAAQAASAVLCYFQVRGAAQAAGVPLTLRGCWQERAVLGSFSLPALLNSALRTPINWLCVALLVNQAGGYAQMGLLHAVNPWYLLLLFLPSQLANVYYPMFEDALARGDRRALRQILRKSMQVNLAACAAIAVVVAAFADSILAFYGPEYRDAASTLRISVATGVVIAAQQPLSAYMVTACSMWLVTLCSVAWAVVFVGAAHALLGYGAVGVATARFLSYAVYAALVIVLGLRALRRTDSAPVRELNPPAPDWLPQPIAA